MRDLTSEDKKMRLLVGINRFSDYTDMCLLLFDILFYVLLRIVTGIRLAQMRGSDVAWDQEFYPMTPSIVMGIF